MEKGEKQWLEYSMKFAQSMIEDCDFCKRTFYPSELEMVVSWLYRIDNLISEEIRFENMGASICVDCKIECLNNPDTFKFKMNLGLL